MKRYFQSKKEVKRMNEKNMELELEDEVKENE